MMEPKFSLNNKISLITGGGSGIGRAIAKNFAMQGSYVHILDYNEKAAADVVLEINNEGYKSKSYKCDVSNSDEVSTVMMDSGIRGGADVARVMASGADFSFLGRTFMYGVSALGKKGGHHTIAMLKTQLTQVMEQLSCAQINDLKSKLIRTL